MLLPIVFLVLGTKVSETVYVQWGKSVDVNLSLSSDRPGEKGPTIKSVFFGAMPREPSTANSSPLGGLTYSSRTDAPVELESAVNRRRPSLSMVLEVSIPRGYTQPVSLRSAFTQTGGHLLALDERKLHRPSGIADQDGRLGDMTLIIVPVIGDPKQIEFVTFDLTVGKKPTPKLGF